MLFLAVIAISLYLRLYNISFGLPHSWYADEPEIAEPAIKYTYEIKNILRNNDIYKLKPESYVYGTFPVYFYTLLTMVYSKGLGMLNILFSKTDIYIFLRVVNAGISFLIVIATLILSILLSLKSKKALLLVALLTGLNWKLIVHAHYLNHDIIITLLLLISNIFFIRYIFNYNKNPDPEKDTLNTILFSIMFGLAFSTKITVLLTYPIYLMIMLNAKSYRNAVASVFIVLGMFILTNPFSFIYPSDFLQRVIEMRYKEAGMVFDSVDYSAFKYISSLNYMLTPPIFITSVIGILGFCFSVLAGRKRIFASINPISKAYFLLFIQVLFYLVFFSIQSRRVDRWLLPMLPILIVFSVYAWDKIYSYVKDTRLSLLFWLSLFIATLVYAYFPYVLTKQFLPNTPKSAAYIWAKENIKETSTKFAITEEGLDPLNKLPLSQVMQFNSYEVKGGQYTYPPDPTLYDYIFISSRPTSWYKKKEIKEKFPMYYHKWAEFENTLKDETKFMLSKSFTIQGPNLIPLSNVYVYKNLILK